MFFLDIEANSDRQMHIISPYPRIAYRNLGQKWHKIYHVRYFGKARRLSYQANISH